MAANPLSAADGRTLQFCASAALRLRSELQKLPEEVKGDTTVSNLLASCTAFEALSSQARASEPGVPKTEDEAGGDETEVLVSADLDFGGAAAAEDKRQLVWAISCCMALLLYIFLWGLVFTGLEQNNPRGAWTWIDGWYFSVLTMGTVGYGVLIPSNDASRICVILCLVFGLTFALYTMGVLCELMLKYMEIWLEDVSISKGGAFWQSMADHRTVVLVSVLCTIFTFGILWSVCYENWTFLHGLYWVVVTLTTVGYGDFAPTDSTSRLVMSFYILLCAGVFGAVISLVIAGHLALQKRAAAMRFLLGNLSLTTLASYKEDVDRQYFLEFMLEKMGYVDHTVITLVNAAFDKLDVDGTNTINMKAVLENADSTSLVDELRREYGLDEDAEEAPVGLFGIRARWSSPSEKPIPRSKTPRR